MSFPGMSIRWASSDATCLVLPHPALHPDLNKFIFGGKTESIKEAPSGWDCMLRMHTLVREACLRQQVCSHLVCKTVAY